MDITGVDFICVPTQDIEKAREFYGGVLGLPFSKQWGNMPGFEYETGTLTIAVMQSDAFGIEFQRHSHPIALHVPDVAAAREELEGKGVTFVADTIDSGVFLAPTSVLTRDVRVGHRASVWFGAVLLGGLSHI